MNVLDQIFAAKREELERLRATRPLADVKAMALDQPPTRGFLRAIKSAPSKPALIAEVKKKSPVKGMIRADFDPVAIATTYESAGASCVSVLTDSRFEGIEDDLISVRNSIQLPILRKDFTADEYHVYEARAMGADAILLICYSLEDSELHEFSQLGEELGLDVLFEAHTIGEAERALAAGAKLLGINNRDLASFETSPEISLRLLPQLVGRATLVSESALHSRSDVQRITEAGADAVLIGTAFCSKPDVGAAVKEVMGW